MGQQFSNRSVRVLFALPAIAAIALTARVMVAQEAPKTREGKPAASSQPASTQASTKPSSTQPSGPDNPPKPADKISLNFKDAPLDAVLDYMATAAGFSVMKDGPVEGRVNLVSKQPVTPAEAAVLLGAALKTNGYTAIQGRPRAANRPAREGQEGQHSGLPRRQSTTWRRPMSSSLK